MHIYIYTCVYIYMYMYSRGQMATAEAICEVAAGLLHAALAHALLRA